MNQYGVLGILWAVSIGCANPAAISGEPLWMQPSVSSGAHVLETERYSHAFAAPACAPTDGPAFTLYLLDTRSTAIPPTTRHMRITIYQDPSLLAHQGLEWQESRGEGVRCSASSCVAIHSGRIDFGNIQTGKSVDGELDLHFTDGSQVQQRFQARWRRSSHVVVCG